MIHTKIDTNFLVQQNFEKFWPHLTTLTLEFCNLTSFSSFSSSIFEWKLPKQLENLSLIGNQLIQIPFEIFTLKKIFVVYLSLNPITQLPLLPTIHNMSTSTMSITKTLQILALEKTFVNSLPKWIFHNWLDQQKTNRLLMYDTPFCTIQKPNQIECERNYNTSKGIYPLDQILFKRQLTNYDN
jgi:Leucine-rich repeat (LRR) protein